MNLKTEKVQLCRCYSRCPKQLTLLSLKSSELYQNLQVSHAKLNRLLVAMQQRSKNPNTKGIQSL